MKRETIKLHQRVYNASDLENTVAVLCVYHFVQDSMDCLHVHFGEFVQYRQCGGGGVEVIGEAFMR